MSIGVWVGLIAAAGGGRGDRSLHASLSRPCYEQAKKEGRLRSLSDLQEVIRYGAVKRLRPKFMTVATTFLGLVPIMWSVERDRM